MKSDSQIISAIEHYPHPAYLKAADTDTFIACNEHAAKRWGLSNAGEFVGRTLRDFSYVETAWGRQHAEMIAGLDFRVRQERKPLTSRHAFLDANGDAQWVELIKLPVLSRADKVIANVSYRRDLTQSLSYAEIYQLYRHFYNDRAAINLMLTYLGIDSVFATAPTETQFRVLLAKADRFSAKQTAKFMGISHRTVECHVEALSNKVIDADLQSVLARIQRRAT